MMPRHVSRVKMPEQGQSSLGQFQDWRMENEQTSHAREDARGIEHA
jgi:hypothetical protein